MRRLRMFMASVVAAGSLMLVSPAVASAQGNCETLQNAYAVSVSKALDRARALGVKDSDFVKLRDDLQKAAEDNDLSLSEQASLASKYPVLIQVQNNEADKALVMDLLRKYFAYFSAGCERTNGDADQGTGPAATTSAAPTSKPSATATSKPVPSSGSQVATVPNDAPETGDGSLVSDAERSGIAVVVSVAGLLVMALSGLVIAARRSRS